MLDRKLGGFISANPPAPTQASAQGVWDGNQQVVAQLQNAWPLPPNVVQRSLRFNSADSPSLSRTPGVASNRRTYTWSGWCKLTSLAEQVLFNAQANSSGGTQRTLISIASSGFLYVNTDNLNTAMIWTVSSNNLLRDFSAWYHIVVAVDTTQATAANRVRMYINGVEVSYAASTYPSQNYDDAINNTVPHYISYEQHPAQATKRLNGYMAEVNFVDGQALTPSSFGETDPQTGIWVPKRYTGTYGTNGFRLPFSNNSSTTALGFDASGNGNNFTPNGLSVTPGSGNDSLLDVPSLYGATDTGLGAEVRGNYCTWNPLDRSSVGGTTADGNLSYSNSNAGAQAIVRGTVAVASGKWYWETTVQNFGGSNPDTGVVASAQNMNSADQFIGNLALGYSYAGSGQKRNSNTGTAYGASYTTGDIIGIALDMDAGTLTFYKNGVSQGVAFTGLSGAYAPAVSCYNNGNWYGNFGQRPFAFPAPAGFKALCTTNFVAPAIGQTAANQADNHFNVVTYKGDGAASKSITGVGFRPDLVWIKSRTNASGFHILVDAVRGAGLWMATNSTNGDSSAGQLVSSLDADGFSLNLNPNNTVNELNADYVAWCWNAGGTTVTNNAGTITAQVRANPRAGFSIISYTGNGSANQSIGHGLGVAPKLFIIKDRDASVNWFIYTTAIDGSLDYMNFTLGAKGDSANSVPNSDVLYMSGGSINATGNKYICYAFAEIPGYSSIGSFVQNASADGAFVYTGFRPRYVLMKSTGSSNWMILDSVRDTANFVGRELIANGTSAESTPNSLYSSDFVSNGFKVRNTGLNATFIYLAIAEAPFRLSSAR